MISFKNFLNLGMLGEEQEIESFQKGSDLIEANCQQFLKESEGHYLCRGIRKSSTVSFFTPQPRDREPVDSSHALNVLLSMGFQSILGEPRLRASSYFATGNSAIARDYGPIFYIFPLDGYSYVWSREIEDAHLDNQKLFEYLSTKLLDTPLAGKVKITSMSARYIFSILYNDISYKSLDVDINSQDFYNSIKAALFVEREDPTASQDTITDSDAEIFIEAVRNVFEDFYIHNKGLNNALNRSTEIAFFKGKGYYAISKSLLETEGLSYEAFYKSIT